MLRRLNHIWSIILSIQPLFEDLHLGTVTTLILKVTEPQIII
jgi:hypothetical protein